MSLALADGRYRRLRQAAATHREDLAVRLCGEAGLRPAEVVSIALDDVREAADAYFLALDDRMAYLPAAVEHDLRKYAHAASVGDGDPLFDVSARRIQMLVREVADRAAEETGDERFRDVSSADLRERFVRVALREQNVPPRIVAAAGGYDRVDRLLGHLEPPDEAAIAAAFERPETEAPERLRRTIALVADVGAALAGSTGAEDLERAVCERVAGADGYRFAWTAALIGDDLVPGATAGREEAVAEALSDRGDAVREALSDGEVRPVGEIDGETLVAVPLVGADGIRGVLCVGAVTDPDELERDLLSALGAQVGHALSAVERKRLLLADTVLEVEFEVRDDAAFLVATARALDCTLELSGLVPADDGLLCYLDVRRAPPSDVLDRAGASDAVTDARFVRDTDEGALVQVTLARSPARTFAAAGGRVRSYRTDGEAGRLVGEASVTADVRGFVETLREEFPEVHLAAKREAERAVETDAGFRETLSDRLTEKQASALRAAYYGGYFDWPRGSTAEELADSLGVSSPTLHNHLRAAQQKLLAAFLDEEG